MRLIIEDLEGSTTVVNLGTEAVTIGRKPHNTIQLTEQNVSRSHAKLVFQDDGWLIEDLGSYNGVRVNGVPIQGPTVLRESDLIQIGDYHLTLTDDVDRATVDIGPRVAANDGYDEFARAGGASSELPSVSVEDLPPMRPPNMAPGDSAAYRTDAITASGEDEKKNKVGLIIGIVGTALALVAVGVWVSQMGDDEPEVVAHGKDPEPADKVETDTKLPVDDTAAAMQPADTGAVAEVETSGEAADTGELVETDGGSATDGELVEDDGELVETDDGGMAEGELVETDGGEEVEEPPKRDPKPKTHKRDKPSAPKLPPDQALAEARKASLTGNNRKAYSLAKDAYDQNKSSDALNLMGVAACKMSSASKAKAAYKKMSNAKDKANLEKICKPLGIELQ